MGGTYVDPNFGATVKILSSFSAVHGYSTPTAFSAAGKYVALAQNNNQVNVVETATGKVVYTGRPGTVTADTIRWDVYNDDIYYFLTGPKVMRHTLSTNSTTTVVDYSANGYGFTLLYGGGTGDISKDNWIGFAAPNEHQVCTLNLNTVQSYCADYTAAYPGNNVPYDFIDYTHVSRGVDSVSGKRYVLLMANPSIAVFSVNLGTGKLNFEFRGPELPPDWMGGGGGNNNGVCDSGEKCFGAYHSDMLEDSAGRQFLVYSSDMETPCQRQITTSLISSGIKMVLPASQGGGRTDVTPLHLCGGGPIELWAENHTACARKAPFCVISTEHTTARNPTDLTTPIPATTHNQEIIAMRGNGEEIRRVATTRSVQFTNDPYWSFSRASISQDGGYVLWDSNFGHPNHGEAIAMTSTGFSSAAPAPTGSPIPVPIVTPPPVTTPVSTPPTPTPTPTPTGTFTPIRVHSGGAAYTDPAGHVWVADTAFDTGSTYQNAASIKLTTTPALYQTERYGWGFKYNFPVPNGTYSVHLKFAEIYWTKTGQRMFNVAINGTQVLSNFDILAAAGAPFTAIDKGFNVTASNGVISIAFTTLVNNAKISAIEIVAAPSGAGSSSVPTASQTPTPVTVPVSTPPPTPTPAPSAAIRVNAGGPGFVDQAGNTWSADMGFSEGSTYQTTKGISGTSTPALYQTERYSWGFRYSFNVPNGNYLVNLKFAELYWSKPGDRIFNVAINGTPVLSNFDIVAAAGGPLIAIDKPYNVTATNGTISIVFTTQVNYAKINAIEITPLP